MQTIELGKTGTRVSRLAYGCMRLAGDGNEHTDTGAFIWKVEMEMLPFIDIAGRDKFMNGSGEMLIKILSIIQIFISKKIESNFLNLSHE